MLFTVLERDGQNTIRDCQMKPRFSLALQTNKAHFTRDGTQTFEHATQVTHD